MARYALCVGINNYPGTDSDLSGCVNDANDWEQELTARGYQVTKLLDADATRARMHSALESLIGSGADGDRLVFTYSGHGSWLPDQDGDEQDKRDEMLCPHDVGSGQYLLDDDLADLFAALHKGASLTFISDSCHSGTVARFGVPVPGAPPPVAKPRFLPPAAFVKERALLALLDAAALAPRTSKQRYPALLLAGCRDMEYSYDASFNNRPNGAFTRVALEALKGKPATPRDWMKAIRKHLPAAAYPQSPQLYGSAKRKNGQVL